ncbi:hypothetical protein [Microbacterium sp. NPDC087589]|uniref:hypothetical protein n=1 Tax=Microbacterium sp. NPDC087589 TaxID=3364191 RepID=UPI00380EC0EA
MHFTTDRARVMLGAIGIGALVALAACAPTPQTSSSPTPSPSQTTPAPEPYAGPIVFVGDELAAFALTDAEIMGIVPEAAEVGDSSPVLEQISDGGGDPADPSICEALYAEQSLGAVGARTIEWKVPADPRYGFGRLHVLQLADEAQTQARMDQLLQAAQECAAFTKGGPVTFDAVIPEPSGDVRAFAGTLVDPGLDWQTFSAFAATGNVIVQLWQPFTGDRTFDAEAAALLLQTRAEEARAGLIEELTENPPVAETDPSGDPGTVWSDWQIGVGGVGPLRLGDSVDSALAAAGEDAQVVDPEYDGGPWRVVAPGDAGSILVQPVDAGDAVRSITVGNERSLDEAFDDGAALPHRGDIRLGAPVADAMAAYPGGTVVDVTSSGDDYYAVTTRDGQVFRFQADRDVVEEGSTIVGITVEDATARKDLVFG